VIVGLPALWWMEHPYLQVLGALALLAGVLCAALGIRRFLVVRRTIEDR